MSDQRQQRVIRDTELKKIAIEKDTINPLLKKSPRAMKEEEDGSSVTFYSSFFFYILVLAATFVLSAFSTIPLIQALPFFHVLVIFTSVSLFTEKKLEKAQNLPSGSLFCKLVLVARCCGNEQSVASLFLPYQFKSATKVHPEEVLHNFPIILTGAAPLTFLYYTPIFYAALLVVSGVLTKTHALDPQNLLFDYTIIPLFTFIFASINFGLTTTWLPSESAISAITKQDEIFKTRNPDAYRLRDDALNFAYSKTEKWHKTTLELTGKGTLFHFIFMVVPGTVYLTKFLIHDYAIMQNYGAISWLILILSGSSTILSISSLAELYFKDYPFGIELCINRLRSMSIFLDDALDLKDRYGAGDTINGLEAWLDARYFLERYYTNFVFSSFSPFFGLSMISGCIGVAAVLVVVFTDNVQGNVTIITLIVCCSLFSITLAWSIGLNITKGGKILDEQINKLKRIRWQSEFGRKNFSTVEDVKKNLDNENKVPQFIDAMIEDLGIFSERPRVLGIEIKPTIFQIFQGYIVTGGVAIAVNYVVPYLQQHYSSSKQ